MSAYLNLGITLALVSDLREAEDALISGLQIARKKRNTEFEGAFLGNIGIVYFDQGKIGEALKLFQTALELENRGW